jgi:hypothetical protein
VQDLKKLGSMMASMMETVNTPAKKTCSLFVELPPTCSNPTLEHLNIPCFGSLHCSLCLLVGFGFHRSTAQT